MFDPAQFRNTQVSVITTILEDGLRRRYLEALGHKSYYAARDKIAPDPIEQQSNIFPVSALIALGDYQSAYQRLHIQSRQILQSFVSIEVAEELQLHDEIEVSTYITDVYEQQATHAPLGFAIIDVFGKRKRKFVFHITRITAVRGGFHRSQA